MCMSDQRIKQACETAAARDKVVGAPLSHVLNWGVTIGQAPELT